MYKYWDTVNKTKTVSGVIGNGKDTILDSAKDLILESSDIRAKDNIALNAKNHILMLSTVNTEYKFRTETSSKRKWGRKKTTTKTWIEDNTYANPVELTSGGYILINYREIGAFNKLKNNNIKLGNGEDSFLLRMYGSPTKKSTMVAFEGPLGIKVIGSAANMTDFVAHSKKSLGIFGETKLVNLANIEKVKNNKIQNLLSYVPLLKVFTKETGPGLSLPQLSDEKKEKDDYKYSIKLNDEQKKQIIKNYGLSEEKLKKQEEIINSLINNSHGTYTYESAVIAENIGKKPEEYKVASPDRKEKLEKEIKDLYIQDQVNKISLAIYGPAIYSNSEFLLDTVGKYNGEELKNKYSYGKYQDKGLPKSREMNISPQPYIRKDSTTVLDINEYLRSLREGVGR